MTKEEYISYWKLTAEKDWEAIQGLMYSKSYAQALFFGHLTLEKLLKAHWVKDNIENVPPKIHNLVWLIRATKLKPSQEQLDFLEEYNAFQLEGRYPDYRMKLYKKCTLDYTNNLLKTVNSLREWLIMNL